MQAVILVTSHDELGTTGLILNKPLEHLIGETSPGEGGGNPCSGVVYLQRMGGRLPPGGGV